MKVILGIKLGMTRIFNHQGHSQDITVIQAGPCFVTQIKNNDTDGYQAIQIGFGESEDKNLKKPQLGHLKRSGVKVKYLREIILDKKIAASFDKTQDNQETPNDSAGISVVKTEQADKPLLSNEINSASDYTIGDQIKVDIFQKGDMVAVTGISKGKGFAGTVKRHGFSRGPVTHGSHNIRQPGSIGSSSFPSRVYKGKRMSGHMGAEKVSIKNLEVIDIDLEKNLLLVKGATPGVKNSIILIKG